MEKGLAFKSNRGVHMHWVRAQNEKQTRWRSRARLEQGGVRDRQPGSHVDAAAAQSLPMGGFVFWMAGGQSSFSDRETDAVESCDKSVL